MHPAFSAVPFAFAVAHAVADANPTSHLPAACLVAGELDAYRS
jgi:hypothetical protein